MYTPEELEERAQLVGRQIAFFEREVALGAQCGYTYEEVLMGDFRCDCTLTIDVTPEEVAAGVAQIKAQWAEMSR